MSADTEKYSAKVPLQLKCHNCKEPFTHKVHLGETSFDWTCPECGFEHPSFLGLDITIGVLLLEKSRYELLQEKDFSMSVVVAAMAFESELSRLFLKWKEIECLATGAELDREKAEIGVLLSLEDATKPMRTEAASAGFYKSPWGNHPRLQILTVAELLEGKRIEYPPTPNVTHKKAPRAEAAVPEQYVLGTRGLRKWR